MGARRRRATTWEAEHLVVVPPEDRAELVAATPVLEAAVADGRWQAVSIAADPALHALLADGPCEPHLVSPPARGRAAWLRGLAADACLLLTEERSWARRARRAKIPVRVGSGGGFARSDLTHAVVPPRSEGRRVPTPAATRWRDVAGLVGVWPTDLRPRLYVSSGEDAALRRRLQSQGLDGHALALCAPGSDAGAAGLWPPERHAAVLDGLRETRGLVGVVCVSAGDEDLAEEIGAAARHPLGGVLDAEGGATAVAALAAASLVLTTDAFLRAGAAAFGVPCVYLAGPLPVERGAVPGERVSVQIAAELECAPCLRSRCTFGHYRCMLDLPAERVGRAAEQLLTGGGSA